ncbi:large conductance mechanosensitive channel protein MscL [Streptomyces griseoluteus]|uniref:Large-conductance mechanosensitive channel n=1 Tax=Streptomyces griseoluteus TaxID=29306 RepID=A0A4Z1DHX0_STRGP|nr:large conductance mechanosensitive channel protein MscL [Streptomyces griseoluteus]TGN83015.1 large conductance mechanosensitive channel protein MscL [Streptomyces griseoluteus]GHF17258.1 large-conductance mechanosensitive channel [Streptomyces griseoluteus]
MNAKKEAASILDGFKAFLMRGNVIDLAVAVVIGAAFTNIVNSVVKGIINPLVGAIGTKNLDHYSSCLKDPCKVAADGSVESGVPIMWGSVAGAALSFLITAAVVYFLMVMPMSKYLARQEARKQARTGKTEPEPIPVTELEVLQDIRDLLIAQRRGTVDGVVKQQRPAGPDVR